jgi:pentatricopeptide repeat protein
METLMEGFMREGNYNEVFVLKREMDANGELDEAEKFLITMVSNEFIRPERIDYG